VDKLFDGIRWVTTRIYRASCALFYSGENLSEEERKQTEEKGDPLKDAKKAQFYLDQLIQKLS